MAQKLRAIMFVGSVRDGRQADRVVAFMKNVLQPQGVDLKIFDPKVMPFPLLKQAMHFYPDPSKAPKFLQEANEEVKKADAYVFLGAEYNRSIPPALLNMIDHFGPATYAWKAAMTVSYSLGPQGGNTSAQALLTTFREFGLQLAPTALAIPTVDKSLSENGQVQKGFEFVASSAQLCTAQLVWLATAMKKARESQKPPKSQPYL